MYFDVTRTGEDQGEPANTFMDGQVFGCAAMAVVTAAGFVVALVAAAPTWAVVLLGIAAFVFIAATCVWFRALRRRDARASHDSQSE
jgi:hypothetical protein